MTILPNYAPAPNIRTAGSTGDIRTKFAVTTAKLHALDDSIADDAAAGDAAYAAFTRAREAYDDARGDEAIVLANPKSPPEHGAAAKARTAARRRELEVATAKMSGAHGPRKAATIEVRDAALKALNTAGEVRAVPAKPLGRDAAAVTKASALVVDLKATRILTAKAPLPFEDRLAIATDEIARVAEGVKFGINGTVAWPMEMVNAAASLPGILPVVVDTRALLAHYLRDQIVADARQQLEAAYENVTLVLDPFEKKKRMARLDDDILHAERVLAATIWSAAEAGVPAIWPKDISPLAVLGIEITKSAEQVARERSYDQGALMAVGSDAWAGRPLT